MANRREVPSQFKAAKGRKIESTKALYDHSNKIMLLTYSAGKKNLYIKNKHAYSTYYLRQKHCITITLILMS